MRQPPKHRHPKTPYERYKILYWLNKHKNSLKINVPEFGNVEYLVKELRKSTKEPCIVWDSKGNEKMPLGEAMARYPKNLAVMYVGQRGSVATSTKRIQIGSKSCWVDYCSLDSWKSNCGKSVCEIVSINHGWYHNAIRLPIFSMDIVFSNQNIQYVIDFDASPGIRGTGLDKVFSKNEVVDLIVAAEQYFEVLNAGTDVSLCK